MYKFYLIWYSKNTLKNYKVGELTYNNNQYVFRYTNPEVIDAVDDGFKFYPGFNDLNKKYVSDVLFSNVAFRLPKSYSSSYLDILNKYHLNIDSSRLDLLYKTSGKVLTDTFFFVPSFSSMNVFYLANRRHYNDAFLCRKEMTVGDKLELVMQDNDTIMVLFKENIIGFIPEYYLNDLKRIIINNKKYSIILDKININSNVEVNDKIRVRLLCEV